MHSGLLALTNAHFFSIKDGRDAAKFLSVLVNVRRPNMLSAWYSPVTGDQRNV